MQCVLNLLRSLYQHFIVTSICMDIIYLENASFYQMFGIGIFVSIIICDIT